MKKKLLWIFSILAIWALLATVFGPSIILYCVRQPQVADSYAYSESFLNTYDEVRTHLQQLSAAIEAGVKEAVGTLIVEFGSYGKAPLCEMLTLDDMIERYKKEQK
jgi:hypothetical protein